MSPLLATDRSMGRLAKWLRLLGYDTVFDEKMNDKEFLALADQGRILITRTRSLFPRASKCRMSAITASAPLDQLKAVVKDLGLALDMDRAFSLCIRCNVKVEPVSREQIADRVPDYVLSSHSKFASCPVCGRIYWPGSHEDRGLNFLQQAFPSPGPSIPGGKDL